MKALEEKILRCGKVFPGEILSVSGFLNHEIDTEFLFSMGAEIAHLYEGDDVTKILTVEASGIAIAVAAAYYMKVPVVFAKKHATSNITDDKYVSKVHSYTHNRMYDIAVVKEYLCANDRILVVDDFLARGNALAGLSELVNQAGAVLVGAAIAIEKGFQKSGDEMRKKGMRIESLAIIESMDENNIVFRM